MQKKLNKIIINYDLADSYYLDKLLDDLNYKYQELNNFFKNNYEKNVEIYIWNNRQDFQHNLIKLYGHVKDTTVGKTKGQRIDILSYSERIKLPQHKNDTITTYLMTFSHELVHIFHIDYKQSNLGNWFCEGIACYLGSPRYDFCYIPSEEINNILNFKASYKYYYSMVKYLFLNYSLDEILKFAKDDNYVFENTERIILETNDYLKRKSI